jgi:uncharacterized protein
MTTERHLEIDVVRGFAVLGILLMNITGMGLPSQAYVDPTVAGGSTGANLVAWGASYLLVDGKMRALFTLLFGASLLLIADGREGSAPGPVATHYRRMFWLFGFGMIHAWAIWFGDILVGYALAGSLAFMFRKQPPRRLFGIGLAILALLAAYSAMGHFFLDRLRAAAEMPGASAATIAEWRETADELYPTADEAIRETALYLGSITDAFAARKPLTMFFQTYLLPTFFLWEALGLMLVGMGLFRSGFFTGGWSEDGYRRMLWLLPLGVLLTIPPARLLVGTQWDMVTTLLTDAIGIPLHLGMALGYAAGLILMTRSGRFQHATARLAACGRMALTNYLGASLITTTLFYGYGFGLFGSFKRAELIMVVIGVWFVQILFSTLWLKAYRYGPMEWIWRTLVRGESQPMR